MYLQLVGLWLKHFRAIFFIYLQSDGSLIETFSGYKLYLLALCWSLIETFPDFTRVIHLQLVSIG